MSDALLYSSLCGFACGIFLRSFAALSPAESLALLLISFALAIVWRRAPRGAFHGFLASAAVFLACASLGIMRMDAAIAHTSMPDLAAREGTTVELTGTIVGEPDHRENSTQLAVATGGGRVLVFAEPLFDAAYGDTVKARGVLTHPEPFETDYGRIFDYEGYLHARGITYMLPRAHVEVLSHGGNAVLAALFSFKHKFLDALEAAVAMPEAGLGEGLLLGVKTGMGEALENAFRATGVVHIVVLSGYNITLVMTFVMTMFAFLLPQRLRILSGFLAIVGFALLVGPSATVVRASVMAGLSLLALLTGRTYAVLRALFLAGALMLLFDPYLLVFDVGFQFSMIATFGLVLLSTPLEGYLRFIPASFGIRGFLTATLATQIFILPILLYHMGQFSLVAVPVNVLVLPAVGPAMLLSFLASLLALFSPGLAMPLGLLAQAVLSYILFVVRSFAALPFATFGVPVFPFYLVILAYVLLAALLVYLARRPARIGPALSSWTIVEEQAYAQSAARPYGRAARMRPPSAR